MEDLKINQEQLDELYSIQEQIGVLNKRVALILADIGSPRPPHAE